MDSVISVKNLDKFYAKKQALFNINLDIKKGEIYGLLGPSGGGKTTLVKSIVGIIPYEKGDIRVLNTHIPNLKIMNEIGYMAQSDALYETLSAKENLKFFGSLYKIKKEHLNERIDYVLNLVNLYKFKEDKIKNFSGGMKRRLSLAISLLNSPKILILDEPTVGIDPLLRKDIWEELYNLSNKGVSIIVTTHIMDEALKCHHLSLIREGHIIANGSSEDIIKSVNAKTLEEAFILYSKEKN